MVENEMDDAPEEEPIIMTQSEFVKMTGFSRSTVCRWVKDGTLPIFFVGGRRYIRRDLIWAWLDQHSSGGKAPERGE